MQSPAGVPLQSYWGNVAPQYQYYNTPYDDYGYEWYAHRHLAHPEQYTMYQTDPAGACGTYYYQFQGLYYCHNGN